MFLKQMYSFGYYWEEKKSLMGFIDFSLGSFMLDF